MSGDGGSDGNESDKSGSKSGFSGVADAVSGAFSDALGAAADLSEMAGQNAREAAARTEAANSLTEAGFSNLSGSDTFSTSTGKSTGTTASASATATGTSGATSGAGGSSSGRGSSAGGFSEGLGADIMGALTSSTALSSQGNLMEAFNPVTASSVPSAFSPARTATLTDTMTYTAPSNARSVDTFTAHAHPSGYNAQATERAGRFSKSSLGADQFADYRSVLDLAIAAEARKTNPYDSLVWGKGTPTHAELQNMTVAEVMDYQKGMKARGHRSTAVGAYQTMAATLGEMVTQLDIDPNTTMFDQQTQDRIGAALMDRRGYKDHKAGKISADQFADNLAMEWAGFANRTGKSHYAGVNGNKATVSRADVMAAVGAAPEAAPDPNAFTGDLNVAMAPTGVELDNIDLPGSRSFASNQTGPTVGTPGTKPGSSTAVASFDNAVGPLAEHVKAGAMPTTVADLATVLGAPTQVAQASIDRLESAYLDPDVRSVQTQTISVTPGVEQAPEVAALSPEVRSVPTISISSYQPTDVAPTAVTYTPEEVEEEERTGLNKTAKTVIGTAADVAAGMVPGLGLVNTAAAAVNAGANILGFDNVNVPTVGSVVANTIDNLTQGVGGGVPPDMAETDPSETMPTEQDEAAAATEPEATPEPTVRRLETIYFSPFPTPAERWGADARQYRGA